MFPCKIEAKQQWKQQIPNPQTQKTLLTWLKHSVLLFLYKIPSGDRQPELKQLLWNCSSLFWLCYLWNVVWPPCCKKIAIPSCRPHTCIPGRKKVEKYKAFSMCGIGILNFGGEDSHGEFSAHFIGWEQKQHKNVITWLLFTAVDSGKTCILASMPLSRRSTEERCYEDLLSR